MKRDVKDRVVVVTGAAMGIGAATAHALAERGAVVELIDCEAATLAGMLGSLPDGRAGATVADIRDTAALAGAAWGVLTRRSRIDAVVHCAAIVVPGSVDRCPEADIRDQVEVNVCGTLNVARAFLPSLRRQRAGHLVFVSSLAGLVPLPGESVYAATKFAVRGFAHSLALELRGSGVDVSVVCPDSTRTRMLEIEARDEGSSLSFTSPPLTAGEVALALVRTIERPRLEVTVPAWRGHLIRLLGAAPWLFPLLYPLLDRRGRRNKARYLAALESRHLRAAT